MNWFIFLFLNNLFLIALKLLQLFSAATGVLQKIGEDRRVIDEFTKLGVLVKTAATEALDTEEVLGEIPEEFLDPIQVFF